MRIIALIKIVKQVYKGIFEAGIKIKRLMENLQKWQTL